MRDCRRRLGLWTPPGIAQGGGVAAKSGDGGGAISRNCQGDSVVEVKELL